MVVGAMKSYGPGGGGGPVYFIASRLRVSSLSLDLGAYVYHVNWLELSLQVFISSIIARQFLVACFKWFSISTHINARAYFWSVHVISQ